MRHPDEEQLIARVIAALATRFPALPPARVAEVVRDEHHRLDDAPLRDRIPVLVEHAALDRLRAEADPVPLDPGPGRSPSAGRPSKHPDPLEKDATQYPGLLNGGAFGSIVGHDAEG